VQSFDHILVGTGQATGTLLGRLIPTGDSIAVLEGARVGGSCVNYGCTPTKTLVASARAIHTARRGDEFGFRCGPIEVDYPRIRARMNTMRERSSRGLVRWMESSENVTLIREWGSFESDSVIRAGAQRLRGAHVYLNVGTRPRVPSVSGFEAADGASRVAWVDSAGLLDLEHLPEHLVILGGGYVGVELAQVYRRFGSDVTVLQRSAHLMPREDEDVSLSIRERLESEGVRVVTGADVQSAEPTAAGGVSVRANTTRGALEIDGTHLLLAAGRRPNSDGLKLENTSIRLDERGFIQVDDVCRTDAPGVFAVGDVNGHGAFTHTAVNDAEIVLDHLFGGTRRLSTRIPIYGLFTDPPLGRVGLTEREALAAGYELMKAERPMARISRAKEMSETHGFAKLLVDAKTDRLLGAAILGPGGDEIVNMFAAIMYSDISCRAYRQVVLVHPTVSELMPWILDEIGHMGHPVETE
jgi:pyruvate/2-oxoglutarate dehydrogenase complex dihydrolipoamide dehydrogenase (E3) component